MRGCAECTDEGTGPCVHGCRIAGFATGGLVDGDALPKLEHPSPYVIPFWADDEDGYDEDEAHNARHPWWFAGCADCDERADQRESDR